MRIEWLEDAEIEIIEDYEKGHDIVDATPIQISAGEQEDVDFIDEFEEHGVKRVNMQFSDGSITMGLPVSMFVEIKEYTVRALNVFTMPVEHSVWAQNENQAIQSVEQSGKSMEKNFLRFPFLNIQSYDCRVEEIKEKKG